MSKKCRVGRHYFFFFFFLLSAKPEIVVSGIQLRYFIFEISGKPSFVEAVFYDELRSFSTFFALNFDTFTSPSGIQLIISASPNVEITSPGRRASGFFNPCMEIKFTSKPYTEGDTLLSIA
jgi:hypothetical protein